MPTNLPHHNRYIILRRPNQRNNPSNPAPSQKQVQQKDGQQIPLAPRQRNKRRQKIHHQPKAAEEREKEKCRENHKRLLFSAWRNPVQSYQRPSATMTKPSLDDTQSTALSFRCPIRVSPRNPQQGSPTAASPASAPAPSPAPP